MHSAQHAWIRSIGCCIDIEQWNQTRVPFSESGNKNVLWKTGENCKMSYLIAAVCAVLENIITLSFVKVVVVRY